MTEQAAVLQATDLSIEYSTQEGPVRSLDGATLAVNHGEVTAVIGESGSGKTTLGLAAGRLLASNAVHVGGDLRLMGEEVLACDAATLRALRRDILGFVFQDPVGALNPTTRIRRQMDLAADSGDPQDPAEALHEVGITDIPRVLRAYPHELSGGMAQRVGIAIALRRRPRLLIADEPTAAVDATRRAKILELLVTRCREQDCALLLLTHDLHTVSRWSTHIAVMYGGRIVERGRAGQILAEPCHPYTRALVSALPGDEQLGERLQAIPGRPPVLFGPGEGCAFAARCPDVLDRCRGTRPIYADVDGRDVLCHLYGGDGQSVAVEYGRTAGGADGGEPGRSSGTHRGALSRDAEFVIRTGEPDSQPGSQ